MAGNTRDLIIFGGGGQGKTLIDLVRLLDCYRLVGIVDDGLPAGSEILGVPVLGGAGVLPELRARGVELALNAVGGIGNVDVRLRVFDRLTQAGFAFPAVIHPSAVVESSAVVEDGVQVLPLTYIGSDARVGFGTLINSHVIVSHDCVIGQVVNLSPGAMLAGGVRVEDYAQIGMGATVNLYLTIGSRARIGNGATVKSDVPPGGRVYAGTVWPPRD
jgi:sugar O-acyltransferase (sialic acid O-acetyltransferase NeuD family)